MKAFANYTQTPLYPNFNLNTGVGIGMTQRAIDTVDGQFVRQNVFKKLLVDTGYWNAQGTGTRRNLVVRTYVTAKQLLSFTPYHGRPSIYGYTYEQSVPQAGGGSVTIFNQVTVNKEVIITAGQPSTLAILEQSGIGDCNTLNHLKPNGVKCLFNNPSVGNSTHNTQQVAMEFVVKIPWQGRTDCGSGNGYFVTDIAKALGQTMPDAALGFVQFLPSPFPGSSDPTLYTMLLILPAVYRDAGAPVGQFGTSHIRDMDTESQPKVAFNSNRAPMVKAVKVARGICDYMTAHGTPCVETGPGLAAVPNNDAAIGAWVDANDLDDFAHMYSGAAMGGADAHGNPLKGAVVDTHCRVYSVDNLRVGDLSIWPGIPYQLPKHCMMYSATVGGANCGRLTRLDNAGTY